MTCCSADPLRPVHRPSVLVQSSPARSYFPTTMWAATQHNAAILKMHKEKPWLALWPFPVAWELGAADKLGTEWNYRDDLEDKTTKRTSDSSGVKIWEHIYQHVVCAFNKQVESSLTSIHPAVSHSTSDLDKTFLHSVIILQRQNQACPWNTKSWGSCRHDDRRGMKYFGCMSWCKD